MSLQVSTAARNALLDAIETAIGASAILKIRTGAAPTNRAAADSGTVVATCNLPADYLAAASGGTKAKSGTWEDTSADATTVDNVSFAAGQTFTVTGFTLTAPNP